MHSTPDMQLAHESANPLADARIAFVGAGVMAESMIAGLLKNALIPAGRIVASHPREDRRQRLSKSASAFSPRRAISRLPPAPISCCSPSSLRCCTR